jgi:lipid-binding SYLF domain-containing protein
MKNQNAFPLKRLNCGLFAAAGILWITAVCFAPPSFAADAEVIDAKVNSALKRFYQQVKGAKEFAGSAKGLLIMPGVMKAAFIVGGEYGEGALRINGRTVDYYNIVSGSFGFQIGAEAKDIVIAFMTQEALQGFRSSKGWEAGVDGNVALITIGAGERADTRTGKDPIVGFVFDVKGLMADISLKGAKFTKLDKSKTKQ